MTGVVIPHDCPHCGTTKAPFSLIYEHRPPRYPREINTYLACNVCGRGAVAVFVPKGKYVTQDGFVFKTHYATRPDEAEEISFSPTPDAPDVPKHLPENVFEFFRQGVANIKTGPDAAGAMFRKALDVGLKVIAPDAKGNLVKRIKVAHKAGLLTASLADWADHVRLEGNAATHDEAPYTQEEAKALHAFSEMLLVYLFTLPGEMAEKRQRFDPGLTDGASDHDG